MSFEGMDDLWEHKTSDALQLKNTISNRYESVIESFTQTIY